MASPKKLPAAWWRRLDKDSYLIRVDCKPLKSDKKQFKPNEK